MTNLKFLTIRRCYGFEWESFKDLRTKGYTAICHKISKSVSSESWDGLWENILLKSKEARRSKKSKKQHDRKRV